MWAPLVEMFHKSQSTLSRERYQRPDDWLHMEQITGEWTALLEILSRKSEQVAEKIRKKVPYV